MARRRGWHELSRALTHKKSANRKITYVISARAPEQKTTPTPRPRSRRCFMRRAAANGSRPRQRSRPPWEILLARIGERPTAMPNTRQAQRAHRPARWHETRTPRGPRVGAVRTQARGHRVLQRVCTAQSWASVQAPLPTPRPHVRTGERHVPVRTWRRWCFCSRGSL